MTFLEFIRKNSLLVLIVIVAIGAGLIMMDYSGQGSAFSRDFYIQVNGTNYQHPEAYHLGENGSNVIQNIYSSTHTKLRNRFDANGDEELSADEEAALSAWVQQHPEIESSQARLQYVLQAWCFGPCAETEDNIAINRAILHEEAKTLGIVPSKEQVDNYIKSLPAFTNADGSFDTKLYQNLTGYYDGVANNPAEQAFRSVISDLIIWESIGAMVTNGVTHNSKVESDIIDAGNQSIKGKTAWLAADKVSAPAEPTEEELKAWWETRQQNYKSEQRRIVSIYTLTPGKDVTVDAMMNTADVIMQDLSMANGSGIDTILENAANNPENAEFSYKLADGSTHITLPLCTEAAPPAELLAEVDYKGQNTTLATIAFNEVDSAPTVAAYEQACQDNKLANQQAIQQMRGFFLNRDNKLVLIKVEAIETPTTLPYEQAKDKALADMKTERADNALALAAEKLYKEMSDAAAAGENTESLFAKATAAGADVGDFGPCELGINANLPEGISVQDLLTTGTGKLCPLAITPAGARISVITERTVPQDTQYTMSKMMYRLPMSNAKLSNMLIYDWMNSARIRYNVLLSEQVKLYGSK
ncbi:MAG: SurA N-terminal domain-containing protein [Akkermansia sp.]|nr:SurA N-terminal domain-containing protein [Akkermansia sp.]